MSFRNLTDMLDHHAGTRADERAFVFIMGRRQEREVLTFSALRAQAQGVAAWLQGERRGGSSPLALLLLPSGLDFIVTFLACQYAGLTPVPMPLQSFRKSNPRLLHVAAACGNPPILTQQSLVAGVGMYFTGAGAREAPAIVPVDTLRAAWSAAPSIAPSAAPDIAFLQYTSGSTSVPRGVAVGQQHVLANLEMIRRRFEHSDASTFAGWVPLHHDQGLVGNVLQPLYIGALSVLMDPATFLFDPLLWLQTLSDYGARTSGGPNFAYDLCVRRYQRAALDGVNLERWDIAFNGAEPVRPLTLERFAETFAAHGFRRCALYPCYGLAESILLTSGGKKGAGPKTITVSMDALSQGRVVSMASDDPATATLVGCGEALDGEVIRIVDPERRQACAPGAVGEVWVAGPHIPAGYWGGQADDATPFGARLAAPPDETQYLRTGDLGFLDGSGELYITGRIKDLIICHGQNFHAQDIEATSAQAHPGLDPQRGIAFGVETALGVEVVLLQELLRTARHHVAPAEAIARIRADVLAQHGLTLTRVLLLAPQALPFTTSGKKQRSAAKEQYLAGAFVPFQAVPPRTAPKEGSP